MLSNLIKNTLAFNRHSARRKIMSSDFTIILHQIAHLGDREAAFGPVSFKGPAFDSPPFECPGVNTSERAILMFQTRSVEYRRNIIRINGSDLFGGIPVSAPVILRDIDAESPIWNSNVALVEPHVLQRTNNILHLEARNFAGGTEPGFPLDNFLIDNVVLFYKTDRMLPIHEVGSQIPPSAQR